MPTIYTIGFRQKLLKEFIGLLREAGVDAIIDIRLRNTSHLAGYSKKEDLAFLLREGFGIAYEHRPELAPTEEILDTYRADKDWPAYERRFGPLMVERQMERVADEVFARLAALDPTDIEYQLLNWQSRGWLEYRPAGRDVLLERLPPPADAPQRVDSLLETYAAIQAQRIEEIVAYAKTRRCRHGHISAYFGGRVIERCDACDNCLGLHTAAIPQKDRDERQELMAVLRCVGSLDWSYGRRNLSLILKGAPHAPVGLNETPGHGALAHRSASAIERLIDRLIGNGLLQTRQLDHGGQVIEISAAGLDAIGNPQRLDALVTSAVRIAGSVSAEPSEPPPDVPTEPVDEALFERLRQWRLETAKAAEVPPYVVAHNTTLRSIAALKPQTLPELEAAWGMGPKKLADYGEAIVEVVKKYLGEG